MSSIDELWNTTAARIPSAEYEQELISAAADGDEKATVRLFTAYVGALRNAVAVYTRALPLDDARQAAFIGFLTAIRKYDSAESDRLASIVREYVHGELTVTACEAHTGFSVPARSLKRYLTILSRSGAEGVSPDKLAPRYGMPVDTYWAIRAAITYGGEPSVNDSWEAFGVYDHALTDLEDRELTDLAFRAVTPTEADVVRLAYGFADYDPQPDAEVGFRLGFSRLRAHRIRHRALSKMRSRVGAIA